jgi:mannose-1-phosphate guanylyltransferase
VIFDTIPAIMQAVILIGGLGSRLRPLTCDIPKPLLPLVNRPCLEYQFNILKSHGIRDVILCTSYRQEIFRHTLRDGRRHGMRLSYVHEPRPLGTGGALRNAARLIKGPSLVLNGDVLNALDVAAFLRFHKKKRADISIALTRVKDPTQFGLVETDDSSRIRRFVEKPSWDEIRTNTVNAGTYVFERGIIDLIPAGINHSLERSLFPLLLQQHKRLFGFIMTGYWIDIGTVEKYLQVHADILKRAAPFPIAADRVRAGVHLGRGVKLGRQLTLATGSGRIVLGARSRIADFARLYGPVSIGPSCSIGQGAQLENCVVLEGARIGEGAQLKGCVVGGGSRVGAGSSVTGKTVLAAGSTVKPYSLL